ncbi:MAG: NAD(P)H-dependent oxidoreductase subunit E [Bacillota bacterium]
MSKIKLTKVPFSGTAKQEKELKERLAEIKKMDGALMPALQAAQDIYGYLPEEVQLMISEELNISLEEIFGVATFYSQFTLNPQGNIQIAICMGTACYVKGSGDVLDKFKDLLGIEAGDCTEDGKYGLVATRCIGCCGLAPVLTVNDKVYGKVTVSDVEKIIEENS